MNTEPRTRTRPQNCALSLPTRLEELLVQDRAFLERRFAELIQNPAAREKIPQQAILDALLEILRNVHDLTTKVLRGGPGRDAAARFNTFYKLL